jgi:rubrerythrin
MTEPMQITERELRAMTRDLDELHESTFPEVRKTLADFVPSRRAVLLGAAGVATLGGLPACARKNNNAVSPAAPGPASSSGSMYTGEVKVVALAAAMENLAVTAYDGALKRAADGKLGAVPPAIAAFVETARKQHADHATVWNSVLAKANKPAITDAPLSITVQAVNDLNKTASVADVVKLALSLEDTATQTYTFAAANVTDVSAIMTAATIQPVEAMHAAILNFVLGQYPVPVSFITIDKAVNADVLTK